MISLTIFEWLFLPREGSDFIVNNSLQSEKNACILVSAKITYEVKNETGYSILF